MSWFGRGLKNEDQPALGLRRSEARSSQNLAVSSSDGERMCRQRRGGGRERE
jgi:hypothetical protein